MQVLFGRYPNLPNIYKKLPPQENVFLVNFLISSEAPNKMKIAFHRRIHERIHLKCKMF